MRCILATFAGQKALLKEENTVNQDLKTNLFGFPAAIMMP